MRARNARRGRRQRPRENSSNVGVTFLLVFVGLGLIAAMVLPPLLVPGPDPIPAPLLLAFEEVDEFWQRRICDCNETWDFASDERNVSNAVFAQVTTIPDPRGLSSLAAFWGQVVDHDIVSTRTNASDGMFSITMSPAEDVLLNLVRANHRLTSSGCRETPNNITSVLDASFIYGGAGHEDILTLLRNGSECKLRTSPGNLLPFHPTSPHEFLSGDDRNTEHAVLASFHTLFMREHNRLCDVLLAERPHWSGEQRFWKARQVVVAKVQHITYNEWLPALMGSQFSLLDSVTLKAPDTRIAMEFSTAVYRFGHSMIPEMIGNFTIPQIFFNRTLLVEHGVEPFLRGAYEAHANQVDNMVIDGLRNFLFMAPGMTMGEDLVSRNLFRSRELGMGSYAQVAACYGVEPQNDEEELYVGMLREPLVAGSSLPRLIGVVVAEQFRRLRDYDVNFYTRPEVRERIGGKFVAEVFATTMASVIRANTNLVNVPDNVFMI